MFVSFMKKILNKIFMPSMKLKMSLFHTIVFMIRLFGNVFEELPWEILCYKRLNT